MQRGRLLILVGLLLLLVTAGLFLILSRLGAPNQGAPALSGEAPTAQPLGVTQVVIAVQPLPRGSKIPPEAVALAPWPTAGLPPAAVTDVKEVIGKLAKFDIERGSPVFSTMVAEDVRGLSAFGSDAALRIPPGKVAITIPITRLSGVGYALQEGDHVNVLVSLLIVSLDETFQSILPNITSLITSSTDPTTGAVTTSLLPLGNGIFSTDTPLSGTALVQPSEKQRPRLVVQQIVQDAAVLKVGTFTGRDFEPTPTPAPSPPPADSTPPPQPTPTPPPDIITLVVEPQDSLVLNYFMYAGARFTLALRAAGDASRVDTESVTLQYTIERFRISVPTQLNYGLEPAIREYRPPALPNEVAPQFITLPDGTVICGGAGCP